MTEVTGRAGGDIRHLRHQGTKQTGGTRADRASILHESMRDLDPVAAQIHARLNPNIVLAETHLNVAMVNDGQGGFRRPSSTKEVLDYGDARIGNVFRKWNPKSFETTLIVVHLPKTMCVEVPDFYPVVDADTGEPVLHSDGRPKTRSRWVARDRQEALAYFDDALRYYGSSVLTGGQAAIHGYDINFDESTPHIQIMADTLAPDPKHDGKLRVEASQMWGAHRDVTVDKIDKDTGQPIVNKVTGEVEQALEQPKAKMSRYQAGLREHMYDAGYPVELDFDPERHLSGLGKDEYAEVMDSQRDVQERGVAVRTRETLVAAAEKDLARAHEELAADKDRLSMAQAKLDEDQQRLRAREGALDERQGILDRREAEMPLRRRRAVAEGRKEGREQAICNAEATVSSWLEAYAERFREQEPAVFSDFLDRVHSKGRTLRPLFEQYVDARIKQFEVEHNVVDILDLEPGDRERYIQDGGAQLAAEVEQLQRDRQGGS